jgi:hypothetical protein
VLRGAATTELEVRFRPLLVGACDATLKLECPELGLHEWGLKLAGAAVNPERGLAFSVPLGGRGAQAFRFTHYLQERAEYRCYFRSAAAGSGGGGGGGGAGGGAGGSSVGFDAPATVVAPAAAGPGGVCGGAAPRGALGAAGSLTARGHIKLVEVNPRRLVRTARTA